MAAYTRARLCLLNDSRMPVSASFSISESDTGMLRNNTNCLAPHNGLASRFDGQRLAAMDRKISAALLEYSYVVGADQWGQWFQRVIRLPTRAAVVYGGRLVSDQNRDHVVGEGACGGGQGVAGAAPGFAVAAQAERMCSAVLAKALLAQRTAVSARSSARPDAASRRS